MTVVYPMEIIIMPKTTYILTDYTVSRRIFTDGRDWPKERTRPSTGSRSANGRYGERRRYSALGGRNPPAFKGPRTFEASGLVSTTTIRRSSRSEYRSIRPTAIFFSTDHDDRPRVDPPLGRHQEISSRSELQSNLAFND